MAQENPTIDEAVAYFSAIPWCARLIRAPDVTIFRHLPRGNTRNSRDRFGMHTLGKETDCISHFVSIYKTPSKTPPSQPYRPYTSQAEIPEITTFYAVGKGATGWVGYAHGGLLAFMVDETGVALLAASVKEWDCYSYEKDTVAGLTTDLSIRFRTPAKIPGVLRSTARYKRVKGRRIVLDVTIQNEDDSIAAVGEVSWLVMDRAVEML
jgi:acyl-coenzyme A thioesterase PaaI-like protein